MNLLIVTQKIDINDDNLGFFHNWVLEFSKYYEKVTIICLQKGSYDLPPNVSVLSLGKENYQSRLKYVFNFYKYIISKKNEYDKVFVHMNPIYVILGGFLWKLWGKRIGLWYTHKSVNFILRIASLIADVIFSASKESFKLSSNKLLVFGHGIKTDYFIPLNNFEKEKKENIKIISVGRISKTKNQKIFIDVARNLLNFGLNNFIIQIIGSPITDNDKKYFYEIIDSIKKEGLDSNIVFVGSVRPSEIVAYYQSSDIFVNLSDTGSLDKAILEAMSSGIKVLTSNVAFDSILGEDYKTSKDPKEITEKVKKLSGIPLDENLRKYVVNNHSLSGLIKKITENL